MLNEFIEYSKQDSLALLKALLTAREIYHKEYEVDITKVVSASSLSLLIFRTKFLQVPIPILKRELDTKIRSSYFGGSSDYYKLHGKNLKYYDVNSLYPKAMLNTMPLNYIGEIDGCDVELADTFGFCEAIIESPLNIKIPLLIHHHDEGKNIHPIGKWKATYFSEELKAAVKYGYKVTLIKVYQFSRYDDLFSDYINHFYELKKTAESNLDPTRRQMAKNHLNSLYGMFGRKLDLLRSIAVYKDNEYDIITKWPVKGYMNVNEDITVFLTHSNVDFNLMKQTKSIIIIFVNITFKIMNRTYWTWLFCHHERIQGVDIIMFNIFPRRNVNITMTTNISKRYNKKRINKYYAISSNCSNTLV